MVCSCLRTGGRALRIYRLLQNMPMGPEEIRRLTTAYEQALQTMVLLTETTR